VPHGRMEGEEAMQQADFFFDLWYRVPGWHLCGAQAQSQPPPPFARNGRPDLGVCSPKAHGGLEEREMITLATVVSLSGSGLIKLSLTIAFGSSYSIIRVGLLDAMMGIG
jgi:hypothetical protein